MVKTKRPRARAGVDSRASLVASERMTRIDVLRTVGDDGLGRLSWADIELCYSHDECLL